MRLHLDDASAVYLGIDTSAPYVSNFAVRDLGDMPYLLQGHLLSFFADILMGQQSVFDEHLFLWHDLDGELVALALASTDWNLVSAKPDWLSQQYEKFQEYFSQWVGGTPPTF